MAQTSSRKPTQPRLAFMTLISRKAPSPAPQAHSPKEPETVGEPSRSLHLHPPQAATTGALGKGRKRRVAEPGKAMARSPSSPLSCATKCARDTEVNGTNPKGGFSPTGESTIQKIQVTGVLSAKGFH